MDTAEWSGEGGGVLQEVYFSFLRWFPKLTLG